MKTLSDCWPLLIPILVLTVFALISFRDRLWEHGIQDKGHSNLTPGALSRDSKWLDIPPYLKRKPGAERGACEVLPWPPRWDADSLPSGGWKESCNNEPHCSFVFRNACVQRNQQAEGEEPKWLVEMEEDCQVPDHSLLECPLESGPSGDQITVIRPKEGKGIQLEKGGFDPTPTVLLDRSGGMPGNFYHDTSMAFYPLYVNMLLQGWYDYTGRRIAVVDAYSFPPKGQKGLAELYYVYNQSEVVDWRNFADRKCFREVTFMRTEVKWRCRDHRVMPSPALNGYADLVASHFGLPEERPPLPETPTLFFLYREGSRKLTNWDELSKSLEIPYRVHNMSQSWRQQIEEVRQSSILFGLHGAGEDDVPLLQCSWIRWQDL